MSDNLVPFRPLRDRVMVFIYDDGNTSMELDNGKSLIIGLADTMFDSVHNSIDGKHPGIRPRWAVVTGVNELTTGVKLGDKVLLDEMKWRRGVLAGAGGRRVWDIPCTDILLVDDDGLTEQEMQTVANYLVGFDSEIMALAGV